MNRRSFLRMLASAAPVAAVAPTYFFAPVGGWKTRNPAADALANFLACMCMNNLDNIETAAGRQFLMHPAHKPLIDELFAPIPIQERLNRQIEIFDAYSKRIVERGDRTFASIERMRQSRGLPTWT